MSRVQVAGIDDLDTLTLYRLVRLRVDVFVVEQQCPYPELDGRDLEPGTRHVWTSDESGPTAYLRILRDDAAYRIGRVCTRADVRGSGLAAELMTEALAVCAGQPVVLDAQSYLVAWYIRFGFTPQGPEFVEDGIAHISMRRPSI